MSHLDIYPVYPAGITYKYNLVLGIRVNRILSRIIPLLLSKKRHGPCPEGSGSRTQDEL